jgi:hypothetical protein
MYDENDALDIMTSGTSIQDFTISDVGIFEGMLFEGNLKQNESKKYSICFGGADSGEDFIQQMKIALDTNYTPVQEIQNFPNNINVFPNPAEDFLYCELISNKATEIEIKIVDLLGTEIINEKRILNNPGKIIVPFETGKFVSGSYIVIGKFNSEIITKIIKILR